MARNIAVFGASGSIGRAFVEILAGRTPKPTIHAFSRRRSEALAEIANACLIDDEDEASIEASARLASQEKPLDLVIVATGILHEGEIMPEKSLRELSAANLQRLFHVNTVVPTLIAKYALPRLARDERSVFAVLSARVGSISDNRLGGWYAYRASKAALNMVVKNAAIEIARTNKQAIVVGLHPGTVDSNLSAPFQGNVPEGKLFTPEFSAAKLLNVLERLSPADSGNCFAWNGQRIAP